MAWVESVSPFFRARHESEDADDTARVLEQLERVRLSLEELFPRAPGEVTLVVHGSSVALTLAQPYLLIVRAVTAPAGRRYLVGWFGAHELHVLAPRLLERRASSVPGSREMLLLTPAALYASIVVGVNNPELPPPFGPGSFVRSLRWAWLLHGAAQYFAGQVEHLRPAIKRRLHEGGRPDFPPGVRDAPLLGGTVFDLLAREEGPQAAARLACRLHPEGAEAALVKAFGGRELRHTDARWRAHLEALARA
jgi:hypothetical protein